jgi:hypothetical protein
MTDTPNPTAWTTEGTPQPAYDRTTAPNVIPYTDTTPLAVPLIGTPEETAHMQRAQTPVPVIYQNLPTSPPVATEVTLEAPHYGEDEDKFPCVLWAAPDVGLRVIRTTDFTGTSVWRVQQRSSTSLTTSRWSFMFAAKGRKAMELGCKSCGFSDPRLLAFIATLPLKIV